MRIRAGLGLSLLALLCIRFDCLACSCGWAGPFLSVSPKTDLVVRGSVQRYESNSMEVEVREVLKGATQPSKIRIWGDNGMLCRPYVTNFPIGTEWVFAVDASGKAFPARSVPDGQYVINGCGEFWAKVENGNVVGQLSKTTPDKKETMSLEALRERFRKDAPSSR